MHERYRNANIPIELLRTLVTIAETRSFTKAATKLSLSQPAISAQVRRLQGVVGGLLFERAGGGIALNERGKLVLGHVRRLLDANDRILALAGPSQRGRPVRVGITNLYCSGFFQLVPADDMKDVHVCCDRSEEVLKGVNDGYIDICCSSFQRETAPQPPVAEWEEPLVWVRGPDFLLSPGAPIPLIGWPTMTSDRLAMQTLEKRGARYELVFASPDHRARMLAVAKNIGVMPLAERLVEKQVVVAREYYLPPLPGLPAGIFARDGVDESEIAPMLKKLMGLAPTGFKQPAAEKEKLAAMPPAGDQSPRVEREKHAGLGRRQMRV